MDTRVRASKKREDPCHCPIPPRVAGATVIDVIGLRVLSNSDSGDKLSPVTATRYRTSSLLTVLFYTLYRACF